MSGDVVSYSIEGDVAVLRLDDGKVNALSYPVLEGLFDALERAEDDAKAVALIGREGKFSAGFDLSVMTSSPKAAAAMLARGALLALRIYEYPKPVIFGVTGHALAMGAILLTTPDLRVGAEGDFKIGLNEVAIGMPVPRFAVEVVRARTSPRWFERCVQQAEILNPEQALAAGFIDELVPASDLSARTVAAAQHLADTVHPKPFEMTRRNVRADLAARLRDINEEDTKAFEAAMS